MDGLNWEPQTGAVACRDDGCQRKKALTLSPGLPRSAHSPRASRTPTNLRSSARRFGVYQPLAGAKRRIAFRKGRAKREAREKQQVLKDSNGRRITNGESQHNFAAQRFDEIRKSSQRFRAAGLSGARRA